MKEEKEKEGNMKSDAGTGSPVPAPKLRTKVYPTSPVSELSGYQQLLGVCRIIIPMCAIIVGTIVIKGTKLTIRPFWIMKNIVAGMVFPNSLPSKIKRSTIATAKYDEVRAANLYVERYSLLNQTTDIVNRMYPAGHYCIMYGAKGVGKSTIAERAAKDKKGVIMLQIDSTYSRNDIMRQLLKFLNMSERNPHNIDYVNAFRRGESNEEIHPTLMIEIESAGSDTGLGLNAARDIAQDLCSVCSVLIILAEASAVLEFGKNPFYEKFIHVGELSESEGREYISKLKLNLCGKDIQHVMDNIGTNPATLRSMQLWVHSGKSVEEFIAQTLLEAEQDLVQFPHKAILKALKEHPEGVSPKYFKNMMSEGVDLSDPFAVGVAVKLSDAIVYRIELGSPHDPGRYMIMSGCHKTALRRYEPILPK